MRETLIWKLTFFNWFTLLVFFSIGSWCSSSIRGAFLRGVQASFSLTMTKWPWNRVNTGWLGNWWPGPSSMVDQASVAWIQLYTSSCVVKNQHWSNGKSCLTQMWRVTFRGYFIFYSSILHCSVFYYLLIFNTYCMFLQDWNISRILMKHWCYFQHYIGKSVYFIKL